MQVEIKAFPGYFITDDGRVWSEPKQSNYNRTGKWLKTSLNSHGYPRVTLYRNGKMHTKSVHRMVAEHFIPNPNNLPEVNHKYHDGNKANNVVANLEWADDSAQELHKFRVLGVQGVMKGKKHTEAAKAKMSAASAGVPKSPEHKALLRAQRRGKHGRYV